MDDRTASNLGNNVRDLRLARGLTQQQMASLAGIPRPTWSNLESGTANPTLSVLIRVADALQVRVEELIGPPKSAARYVPAASVPVRVRGDAVIRRLLPEALAGLEIERMEISPRGMFTGVPHTPGTREYLTCESGEIELRVASECFHLRPGDVVVFRGDQKHGYRNPAASRAIAYSVVVFARG